MRSLTDMTYCVCMPTAQRGTIRLHSEKLRTARHAASLTQVELATAIGRSFSTIAYLETGARQPSPETLTAIATVLGVAPHDLAEIDGAS